MYPEVCRYFPYKEEESRGDFNNFQYLRLEKRNVPRALPDE